VPIDSEFFSILINAGGLGAITLVIWNNQNWIKSQMERIEKRVDSGLQDAHRRIDSIMKGHNQ